MSNSSTIEPLPKIGRGFSCTIPINRNTEMQVLLKKMIGLESLKRKNSLICN